jgi:hypothetical protein
MKSKGKIWFKNYISLMCSATSREEKGRREKGRGRRGRRG